MATDGSFTNEYIYRLQQVNAMANKLAAAPFEIGDVLAVYQVRYKPATQFCLPIPPSPPSSAMLSNANAISKCYQK